MCGCYLLIYLSFTQHCNTVLCVAGMYDTMYGRNLLIYLSHFTVSVILYLDIYCYIWHSYDTLYGCDTLLYLIVTQHFICALLYMEVIWYVISLCSITLTVMGVEYHSDRNIGISHWPIKLVYLQSSAFFQVSLRFSTHSISISMVMVHQYIFFVSTY